MCYVCESVCVVCVRECVCCVCERACAYAKKKNTAITIRGVCRLITTNYFSMVFFYYSSQIKLFLALYRNVTSITGMCFYTLRLHHCFVCRNESSKVHHGLCFVANSL